MEHAEGYTGPSDFYVNIIGHGIRTLNDPHPIVFPENYEICWYAGSGYVLLYRKKIMEHNLDKLMVTKTYNQYHNAKNNGNTFADDTVFYPTTQTDSFKSKITVWKGEEDSNPVFIKDITFEIRLSEIFHQLAANDIITGNVSVRIYACAVNDNGVNKQIYNEQQSLEYFRQYGDNPLQLTRSLTDESRLKMAFNNGQVVLQEDWDVLNSKSYYRSNPRGFITIGGNVGQNWQYVSHYIAYLYYSARDRYDVYHRFLPEFITPIYSTQSGGKKRKNTKLKYLKNKTRKKRSHQKVKKTMHKRKK